MGSAPVFSSGFESEEFSEYATSGFKELLDSSPFSETVQFYDEQNHSWYDIRVVIQNKTSDSESQSEIRQILSEIGTLSRGMYVKFGGDLWLGASHPDSNKMYEKIIAKKCNYLLPFQLNSTDVLHEPCVVESQKDSLSGEANGSIITIPDTQRILYVQFNRNTKQLLEGKRLFVDKNTPMPKVFHISKVDRITYMDDNNGLLRITCDEDQVDLKRDNIELLIADYISSSSNTGSSNTGFGSCAIVNASHDEYTGIREVRMSGRAYPFYAQFMDSDGNVINDVVPVWSIEVNDISMLDKLLLISSADGNSLKCSITPTQDDSLLNTSFTLVLTDSESKYGEYRLECKVVSVT